MQEVVITAPRRVALRTVDEEPMTLDSIRVRSLYSGISHGTEMSFYQATAPHFDHEIDEGLFRKRNDGTSFYPVRHGYEMVGEVIEVGSRVGGFEIGDVAWTGTTGHPDTYVCDTTVDGRPFFCERAPAGADPSAGIFLALGGVAYDGLLTSRLRIGEAAVISGLGVIGLMTVQLCRQAGIGPLIVVDPIAARRNLAIELGAEHAIDPATTPVAEEVRRLNRGRGVDAAIETSGSWVALNEAIRCCASGYGRVVALGFYQGAGTDLRLGEEFHHSSFLPMGASSILAINHRTTPATGYAWDRDRVHRIVAQMLGDGTLSTTGLLTHTFPQAEAAAAFDLVERHPEQIIKVALTYG
jgi:2-desacetyl-2-hydroxyethyl bacteriochlorophyllide A dehydrogenase